MSQLMDDAPFDRLLGAAMSSRPEPSVISNLAHRAMERARVQSARGAEAELRRIARLRRRNQWVGLAATILIALVVALGARRIVNGALLTDSSDAAATTSSTTTTASTSTTSGNTLTLGWVLTAELLAVALILLSVNASTFRPSLAPAGETAFW